MADVVRTRFAPSPTGYLHLGGARTALFCYALARKLGGEFVLRIEDTDQTRNIAGAEQKLLDDLRWLGLEWDEGPETGGPAEPYFQSQRLESYQQIVRRLLDEGRAYHAFDTREELEAMRQAAQAETGGFRYPRPERFPSEADAEQARTAGKPVVVRFVMPDETFTITDEILGDVEMSGAEFDDFVIQKSDGWPTYHLAVVADDEAMGVTHVLRGQEHLMNTANHMALQQALGYRVPLYAHLPIILNLDGSKMSKREKDKVVRQAAKEATKSGAHSAEALQELAEIDEATYAQWQKKKVQLDGPALERLAAELAVELPEIDVHDFRQSGYLPEVLLNFIALLGWSPGDDREHFTLDEMCAWFQLKRIGKTNARFDRAKLLHFNTVAVAAATPERQLAGLRDYLSVNPASPLAGLDEATLARLIAMCHGYRTFRDIEFKSAAIFADAADIVYDDKAMQKVLVKDNGAGRGVLDAVRPLLDALESWTAAAIEQTIRGYGDEHGLGLGKVAQPLRVAVTGGTISPSIFDTLELIGKAQTLTRIDRVLSKLGDS